MIRQILCVLLSLSLAYPASAATTPVEKQVVKKKGSRRGASTPKATATPAPAVAPTPTPAPAPSTGLTGNWTGTYSWDCGSSRSGSSALSFSLTLSGTALTGTATYLGSTTPIVNSWGDGSSVHINLDRAATRANNEFVGTFSGTQITGTTVNGDTPPGCSANEGPSGTFTVSR